MKTIIVASVEEKPLPRKVSHIFGLVVLVTMVIVVAGCSDDQQLCIRDSQCPTGHACADGVCSPKLIQDTRPSDTHPLDLGVDQREDQYIFTDLGAPDGDGAVACAGNSNGKIERKEMIFSVPAQVKVVRGGSGLVLNLQGGGSAGKRLWDLTPAAKDDKTEWLKVEDVPKWAAGSFKTATYASVLMGDYGFISKTALLGVFQVKSNALVMVGGVSAKENHTKFTYTTPLETIRFPVGVGDSYTTSSNINGYTVFTVPMWMHEKYHVKVLDRGKVRLLPSFSLDALLVSVKQEAYPVANPFLKTRTEVYILMAECYGVIARVVVDGAASDLTKVKAKERWRLAGP